MKYGLQLQGKIRVFRKDKEIQGANKKVYNITDVWFNVSEKDENDKSGYFNKSMNLIFPRNSEKPENNSIIIVKDSFPIITGNGKWRKIALFVRDYEIFEPCKDGVCDYAPEAPEDDLPF